jgi:hypothetical protein
MGQEHRKQIWEFLKSTWQLQYFAHSSQRLFGNGELCGNHCFFFDLIRESEVICVFGRAFVVAIALNLVDRLPRRTVVCRRYRTTVCYRTDSLATCLRYCKGEVIPDGELRKFCLMMHITVIKNMT